MPNARSIAALALLWAACAAPPEESTDELVTVENGETLLREAVCQRFVRCETAAREAECRALSQPVLGRSTFGTPAALFASVKAGRVRMDPERVKLCLDAIRRGPCDLEAAAAFASKPCEGAFEGTVARGADCITTDACVAGTECRPTESTEDSSCLATCEPVPAGRCVRSVDCDGSEVCARGTCRPDRRAGALGEACGTLDLCETGLLCVRGRCVAPPKSGEECAVGRPCASAQLTCVPTGDTGECRRARGENAPCDVTAECRSPLACDGVTHTCRPRPKSGACVKEAGAWTCDPATARCDARTSPPECVPLLEEGAACARDEECAWATVAVAGWTGPLLIRLQCLSDGAESHCARPGRAEVCRP